MGPIGDSVQWNLVEANLQGTEADVFEIFDCCYAGNFRSNEFSTRIFEFLAATSAGSVTRSPGKNSFTSALIWALRQFAKGGEKFTTSELTNRIKEAPYFPKEQVPVLCERNAASSLRLVLAPLPEGKSQVEQQQHSPTPMSACNQEDREVLTLKLVLEKLPDKTDIARLAKVVKQLIAGQHMLVHRVLWGGIHSQTESHPNLDYIVRQAAKRFLEPVTRRRSSADRSPSPVSSPSNQSFLVPPLNAPNGDLAKKRRRSTSDYMTG